MLRLPIIKTNLDLIYESLLSCQRIPVAILGLIKTEHDKLVFESFVKSQPTTLAFAQMRTHYERKYQDIESQVRVLVADIEENIWTQQRRVDGIKQFI
jgi:hypothetical protein